jgi:formamidopyrimidine-DNA glycosylase
MPELPEVETVMRGLAPVMQGEVITQAHVNRPDLRWPFPPRMADRLTGQRVLALRRRSKYILLDISSGETLLVHLGMSGRMLISGDPFGRFLHSHPTPQKHDHVMFDMANGARVTFNDPRRFGAMDLMQTATYKTHTLLAKIGPEPFGNQFNENYLCAALSGRKTPIKSALLDQRIIAGLGNIYVCETLFRAGISPLQKAANLSQKRVAALVLVIRQVLQEAIDSGGSSLRDFRQTDGELGYFQHSFAVYGREGETCCKQSCKTTIKRVVQSGRSSFYCKTCQK